MATYYVRANGSTGADGSDSNNGTSTSTPFLTCAKAVSVVSDGDTVYFDGWFREVSVTWTAANLVLQAWPGATFRPQIRGDVAISTSGWTGPVSNIYTKTFDAGTAAYGIVANYGRLGGTDYRVLSDGGFYGHLKSVATATNVSEFNRVTATGVTTIRLLGDVAPSTLTYLSYLRAGHGFVCNGANVTVRGIDFVLFGETGAGNGYGVLVNKTDQGFTIDDCRFYDCGYHSCGGRDTNTLGCIGGIISRCQAWGVIGGDASNRPTAWVFYAAGAGKVVSGCRAVSCSAYARMPVQEDGTTQIPLYNSTLTNTANYVGGCHTHTDGSAVVTDVEYYGCSVYYDAAGPLGNPFQGANNTGTPSNKEDWLTYSIRYNGCSLTRGSSLTATQSGTYIAHRNGSYSFTRTSSDAHTAIIKFNSTKLLMDSCVVLGTLAGITFGRFFYRYGSTGNELRALDCTFIEHGGNAGNLKYWISMNAADTIIMRRCIMAMPNDSATNGVFSEVIPASGMTFERCWFPLDARIRASGWSFSTDTTIDTQAEFQAFYSTGTYNTDPGFSSPTTSAEPASSSKLRASRVLPIPRRFTGVNGERSNGTIGAWQTRPAGRQRRKRERMVR